MAHLRLLVGVSVAAALAWVVIGTLATRIGPATALIAGAVVVVLVSAGFHRFWRLRAPSPVVWSPPPGTTEPPLPSSPSRRSLWPLFAIGAAAGVVVVGVTFSTWRMGRAAPPPYGSGGIGSVSAGISEALVEGIVAAAIGVFVVLIYAQFRDGGRGGGDSQ